MNKDEVVKALLASLQAEVRKAVAASKDAASYATDDEARAESKWDTQGLEASYLAAGQAGQARQWAEALSVLESNRENLLAPRNEVGVGALVSCDFEGTEEHFFVAPVAGGHVLTVDGKEVTVVTTQSPIFARIAGRREGEAFSLANGATGVIVRVS